MEFPRSNPTRLAMEAPHVSGWSYAYCYTLMLDWVTLLMSQPIGSGRKALIFRRCLLIARTVNKETCGMVQKTNVFILLQKTNLECFRTAEYYNEDLGWPKNLLVETLCIVHFLDKFKRSYYLFPQPLPKRRVTYTSGWLKDITVGQQDVIAKEWTARLAYHRRCSSTRMIARSAIENRNGQWPSNLLALFRRSSSEPRIRDDTKHQDPRPRRSRSH